MWHSPCTLHSAIILFMKILLRLCLRDTCTATWSVRMAEITRKGCAAIRKGTVIAGYTYRYWVMKDQSAEIGTHAGIVLTAKTVVHTYVCVCNCTVNSTGLHSIAATINIKDYNIYPRAQTIHLAHRHEGLNKVTSMRRYFSASSPSCSLRTAV